jgi:carbon monoxide dehydrogenase subunit G
MATATTTTQVSADPAAVWAVINDPARTGDWVSIHQGYVGEAPTAFENGTTFSQRVSIMGMPADVAWTLTEVDAPTRTVMSGNGPMGISVTNTYVLSPADGGTEVTWTMAFSGGMVMAVGGQLEAQVSAAQRSSLESLKKIVEG